MPETPPDQNDIARRLTAAGHEAVVLKAGEKTPVFRNWPERTPDEDELLYWVRKGMNLGVKAKDMLVIDKDAADRRAYDWLRGQGLYFGSPWVTVTRKGRHIFRRLPDGADARTRLRHLGLPVDLITGRNRYLVLPGSRLLDGFVYGIRGRIVPVMELPEVPSELVEGRKEVRTRTEAVLVSELPGARKVASARRVLAERHRSFAGQGGDMGLFKAACLLIQWYRFDFPTALQLLAGWNADPSCVSPPWDEGRLRYKLEQAAKLMR